MPFKSHFLIFFVILFSCVLSRAKAADGVEEYFQSWAAMVERSQSESADVWIEIARLQTPLAGRKTEILWRNKSKFLQSNPSPEQLLDFLILLDGDFLHIKMAGAATLNEKQTLDRQVLLAAVLRESTRVGTLLSILDSAVINLYIGPNWNAASASADKRHLEELFYFKKHWKSLIEEMMQIERNVLASDMNRFVSYFKTFPAWTSAKQIKRGGDYTLTPMRNMVAPCVDPIRRLLSRFGL